MRRLNLLLLAVSLAAVSCTHSGKNSPGTDSAAANADSSTASNSALSATDIEFANKAATGGMLEVELGKLAQSTALSKIVKDFGAMMVKDHSKAGEELKALALQKNIKLPDSLSGDQLKDLEDLKGKKGVEFDKDYVKKMIHAHRNDIAEFQKAAKNSTDSDLKSFASKTLPVLRMHYDTVRSINKTVKAMVDPGEITDGMEVLPLR